MTSKEHVLRAIEALPDDATVDDAIAELQRLELRQDVARVASPESLPAGDAWQLLSALQGAIEAIPDWAREHDHYLYGTPKRSSAA